MFTYFFSYQTDLPDDLGFQIFGIQHIIWLLGITAFLFLCCLTFCKLRRGSRELILNAVVLGALFMTFSQDAVLIVTGHMNSRMLPLHLCDLASFVFLFQRMIYLRETCNTQSSNSLHFYSPRKRFRFSPILGEIGACLLLPGAVLGILFPVWTSYPMLNFMTIHGFVYHGLIILYPLLLLTDKQVCPRLGHVWYTVVFLLCVVPPVLWFDRKFDSNYMYLNYGPAGTPLYFLEEKMGNPGYLLGYAIGIFLIILLVYGLLRLFLPEKKRYFQCHTNPAEQPGSHK